MNPSKTERLKKQRILMGILLWLLVILLGILVGSCVEQATPEQPAAKALLPVLEDVLSNPLHYFQHLPRTAEGWKFAGIGFLFGAIVFFKLYNSFLEKQDLLPAKENGSAKWNQDMKAYNKEYVERPLLGSGCLNTIITRDIFLSMNTRKTGRNNNVAIIGATGTKKSRGFIGPNLMQASSSYVITDPSGELLESMGAFLESEGYVIKVLNLEDTRYSDCYNPFAYAEGEEGILSMITALIANTTPKGSHSSDPFWEKAETALLQAICFYIREEYPLPEQNFSTVMYLLRMADAEEGELSKLDQLFEIFEESHPGHIAATSYAVYRSAGGGKTAQSIVISAQSRLAVFNLTSIRRLTSFDTMELKQLGKRKTALFCITPVGDPTFNFLVGLMYSQLFSTLYHIAATECPGRRLPVHVRFLLDEFANIGTIPNFNQLLATMRKYEISCVIVLQAISQLKALYRDDWEVIIGNCDTLLFLGGSDKTTLEYFSSILGKKTIRAMSSSQTFGRQKSYTKNFNRIGRELATPAELRTMDNDSCICMIRGLDPFFSKKFDPTLHPNYRRTGFSSDDMLYKVKEHKETGKNNG